MGVGSGETGRDEVGWEWGATSLSSSKKNDHANSRKFWVSRVENRMGTIHG